MWNTRCIYFKRFPRVVNHCELLLFAFNTHLMLFRTQLPDECCVSLWGGDTYKIQEFWTQPVMLCEWRGIEERIKENPLTNVNFQIHCILFWSTADWSKRNKWHCAPIPIFLLTFNIDFNCTHCTSQKLKFVEQLNFLQGNKEMKCKRRDTGRKLLWGHC